MKDFFKNYHGYVSTVITTAAFVIGIFFKSEAAAFAALLIYAVGITWLVIAVYRLFSKSMSMRSKNGFYRMATTCVFRTDDGVNAEFELRRFIQCKTAFMSSVKHFFKWEGDSYPVVTSNGNVLEPSRNPDTGEFDHVVIPIGRNLCYNECAVVSVSFRSSYADVKPVYFFKVTEQVGAIDMKVLLGHRRDDEAVPDAVLYRKRFGASTDLPYDEWRKVSFNRKFKMFEISFSPEVGYIYKFEWTK